MAKFSTAALALCLCCHGACADQPFPSEPSQFEKAGAELAMAVGLSFTCGSGVDQAALDDFVVKTFGDEKFTGRQLTNTAVAAVVSYIGSAKMAAGKGAGLLSAGSIACVAAIGAYGPNGTIIKGLIKSPEGSNAPGAKPSSAGDASQTASAAGPAARPPVELLNWDATLRKGDFSQYYHINYTLMNNDDKAIKLLDGGIEFSDALGENFYGIKIGRDVAIPPGKEQNFSGDFSINQFIPEQGRLATMAKADVVTHLKIRAVEFGDNTVVKYGQ